MGMFADIGRSTAATSIGDALSFITDQRKARMDEKRAAAQEQRTEQMFPLQMQAQQQNLEINTNQLAMQKQEMEDAEKIIAADTLFPNTPVAVKSVMTDMLKQQGLVSPDGTIRKGNYGKFMAEVQKNPQIQKQLVGAQLQDVSKKYAEISKAQGNPEAIKALGMKPEEFAQTLQQMGEQKNMLLNTMREAEHAIKIDAIASIPDKELAGRVYTKLIGKYGLKLEGLKEGDLEAQRIVEQTAREMESERSQKNGMKPTELMKNLYMLNNIPEGQLKEQLSRKILGEEPDNRTAFQKEFEAYNAMKPGPEKWAFGLKLFEEVDKKKLPGYTEEEFNTKVAPEDIDKVTTDKNKSKYSDLWF